MRWPMLAVAEDNPARRPDVYEWLAVGWQAIRGYRPAKGPTRSVKVAAARGTASGHRLRNRPPAQRRN